MARGGVRPNAGRPKGASNKPTPFKDIARATAPEAFERIVKLLDSADENVVIKAASIVLDRAYGRPAQAMTGEGGEGPAEMVVRWLSSKS